SNTPRTQPGMTIGTPDYISPEQARGRDVEPSADVYSLGIMAFEMVTGQLPFFADNAADMLAAHLIMMPERPRTFRPALPAAFDTLILSMLAKDPDARPTLAQVRRALAAIAALPPPRAVSVTGVMGESRPAAPLGSWLRRRATTGLGAFAALALGAA